MARGLMVAAVAIVLMTGAIASGAQGTTTGTAPTADERGVQEEVLQNNPDDSTNDDIKSRLEYLIKEAKDTEIMIASYHFDDEDVAKALVTALGNDVRVRILIDAVDNFTPAYRKVARAIEDAPPGSWIKTCGKGANENGDATSCMGDHIMHNKFFLFKETDNTSKVVVQTSANLNAHSGTKMWNTAYITSDEWLYGKYKQYFDDLAAHASPTDPNDGDPDYYNTFRTDHPPSPMASSRSMSHRGRRATRSSTS
ncbi:MAG: phospholipase D-like domain-containing protein [Pseudonocardiaceae bacterium]